MSGEPIPGKCVCKERVENLDFAMTPFLFDLRISASVERKGMRFSRVCFSRTSIMIFEFSIKKMHCLYSMRLSVTEQNFCASCVRVLSVRSAGAQRALHVRTQQESRVVHVSRRAISDRSHRGQDAQSICTPARPPVIPTNFVTMFSNYISFVALSSVPPPTSTCFSFRLLVSKAWDQNHIDSIV